MKVTVKPGRYFLGDPCYAVPDHLWHLLLKDADYFEKTPAGKVENHEVVSFHTAYGDGVYFDDDGNEFGVDAGMIGLTPVELIKINPRYPDDSLDGLGRFVEFDKVTECSGNRGILKFGDITIDTRG